MRDDVKIHIDEKLMTKFSLKYKVNIKNIMNRRAFFDEDGSLLVKIADDNEYMIICEIVEDPNTYFSISSIPSSKIKRDNDRYLSITYTKKGIGFHLKIPYVILTKDSICYSEK